MGQQSNKIIKRRRRKAYLARKKEVAETVKKAPKPKTKVSKKTAAAAAPAPTAAP